MKLKKELKHRITGEFILNQEQHALIVRKFPNLLARAASFMYGASSDQNSSTPFTCVHYKLVEKYGLSVADAMLNYFNEKSERKGKVYVYSTY